ncbi:MAG: patatin-like phospholipase family protein [Chitinophagaceae bacterium]|nr:patatin-like phospholipase family protein [Chitinophagaceae bacterium]
MKCWLIVLLLPLCTMGQVNSDYKNLVFEGGGIRGLAYAGTIKVLEEKNIIQNIENCAGTSAGAIAALLISLDYSASEIDSILSNIQFQKFNDGKGGIAGKYKRIKQFYGIYEGKKLENWLASIVAKRTGSPSLTFKELHQLRLHDSRFKDFYCTGTNLNKQETQVFSRFSTPDLPITTAVRISVAIPFYYQPVFLDSNFRQLLKPQKNDYYQIMVDGGIMANYPITIFDTCLDNCNKPLSCEHLSRNNQTLGIKLERPEQIIADLSMNGATAPFEIKQFNQYTWAFGNLLMETLNRRNKNELEKGRTIFVSDGHLSPRVRKLKKKEKDLLIQNGIEGASIFFNKT